MKLIMENWQKFLKEQQNWSFQSSAPVKNFQQYKDEDWEEKKKDIESQVTPDDQVRYAAGKGKNDWIPELLNTIIPLFDVTGQVGDVDIESGKVTPQYKVFLDSVEDAKNQSGFFNTLLGAGIATLNGLAMVPVVGKAPKTLAKTTRAVNTSKTVSSKLKQAAKESGLSNSQKMQISNLSKKIDNAIERVTLPKRRRAGSYIRGVQKQINDSFFKLIKAGRLKVGATKNYKIPGGSMLELHAVEIKIVPMKVNPNSPPSRKVISSGSYGSDRLGTGSGKGGDIEIELAINPRFINKDGTIRKEAYGELHKELNKTGFHEMVHSRQATRQRKGSRAAEDRALTGEVPSDYMGYRLSPEEVSAHARDAARGTSIRKVAKLGIDTVDLMAQRISDQYKTFGDLVKARNANHYEIIKKQLDYAIKNVPCAAISAANVLDLEAIGLYDTGKLSQKNQNIVNTFSNKKAIAVNPKNCSKKLMENYLKKIILEELRIILESRHLH